MNDHDALVKALREAIKDKDPDASAVLIKRVPFICEDIRSIKTAMNDMKDDAVSKTDFALLKQQSDLTNKLIIGAASIILIAVMGAMVVSVLK